MGGDDFVVFYAVPKEKSDTGDSLDIKVRRMRQFLEEQINGYNLAYDLDHPIELHTGYAIIQDEAMSSVEVAVYSALKRAKALAKDRDIAREERRKILTDIIHKKTIRAVFQPIVSLVTGEIFGYEALARGPQGTPYESPLALFTLAEELGMIYQLERACREAAIRSAAVIPHGKKLFINIHPDIIYDPQFHGEAMSQLVDAAGLDPRDIIIEITEQGSIRDYETFLAALEHYRNQGYHIAVDDAGAGYSSLQSIARLGPDYIKIDMSLVRNLHIDRARHSVVEALSILSKRINAKAIAEGIECKDELKALIELNVGLGQGYYLAKPGADFPLISEESQRLISFSSYPKPACSPRRKTDIREVLMHVSPIEPNTLTHQVVETFKKEPGLQGIAVVEGEKPLGLVMKDKLYYKLGSQFGYSVYMGRPIASVMDRKPLIVDIKASLDEVAALAMARDENRLYDYMIAVDDNGRYEGIVSIQKLLMAITKLQVEAARCANPLTGLPGNPVIEDEIRTRLAEQSGFAVLYMDIDNFKPFNDVYGFERGDEVIKLTAEVIREAVGLHGGPGGFVGHVGGDDFVAILEHDRYDEVAQTIIKEFDSRIPSLYDAAHRERGYIETLDRKGNAIRFPVMTISIAVIVNEPGETAPYQEFIRNVAELKRYVKSLEGSNYMRERRRS